MTHDPSPMLVIDVSFDSCGGALIAKGEDAMQLRAQSAHVALMVGAGPITQTERAQFLVKAADLARRSGWTRLENGLWRCVRCLAAWGHGEPRRFTVREAVHRMRGT